jgi:hypothetical protein
MSLVASQANRWDTPKDIVAKINEAVVVALADPGTGQKLSEQARDVTHRKN